MGLGALGSAWIRGRNGIETSPTSWCPSSSENAFSWCVHKHDITHVWVDEWGLYRTSFHGIYKPTDITGGKNHLVQGGAPVRDTS